METDNKISVKYEKSELIKSERFSEDRDILTALLDEKKEYSIKETDEILRKWKKGKVN